MRKFSLILLLLATIATMVSWIPKSTPLPMQSSYIGHYRGFGLVSGAGLFGKNYYAITMPPTDAEDGITTIHLDGSGYNKFRGKYPDGRIRDEGECFVVIRYLGNPEPDIYDVKWGKYYDPDGKLRSEVKDGTGTQTYWSFDGTKLWELELRDYQRIRVQFWDHDGKLLKFIDYTKDETEKVLLTE